MKEPEKKVDSSWKDKIEKERVVEEPETPQEPVEQKAPAPPEPAVDQPAEQPAEQPVEQPVENAATTEDGRPPLGQPVLTSLVSQLAMQAMYSLGLVQMPDGSAPEADLEQAQYLIEMLALLEEKTEGNLSDEEDKGLADTIHQLRMAFVAVTNK